LGLISRHQEVPVDCFCIPGRIEYREGIEKEAEKGRN